MQAVLECKQCGAQLEVLDNQKIVQCKFCGSSNAVSFIDRMGLYNRANYLRRQNEFDRAISVYEDILKEDAHDAEAYYGIALCKYGIEYVDDPNGKGKIPTCHRTRYTPISQDIDFKKAIENADNDTAMLYAEEAGKIDRILLKIQALSNKHEKYDVFICYKEGDGMGGRTQTSVFAQDIYQELVRQGYKVFFARKTLETKLGSDYEPIIFAALFSAKVMLVVGTKPEEFQGVWVRNEWTRYRERMANGEACSLIPLYRDMSPYELPQEFVNLQALDMGKIGFMQDLSDGLAKLIRKDTTANVAPSKANAIDDISNVNLKKRARLELEQGNFRGAATYIERALDKEPEDAEAYIMKVQISRECRSEDELGEGLDSLESDNNYQLALRFALPDALERYKNYEELIQQRLLEIEKAEEEARIRKEKEDEDYRKRLEEEKERKKLENERKRQEAKARNKILRKRALKVSIYCVIFAMCLPILCFIYARVMQDIYLKTENVCGLYNLRNTVEDFLRETGIYYEWIVLPNYNVIEFKTDFFMKDVDRELLDEIYEDNISETDWEKLEIEEYTCNGFEFGVTQEGKLCYRWNGNGGNFYISGRVTYYTLRNLKKELDKKGKIKQLEATNWNEDVYFVMENGDVEYAKLDPTWKDYDSGVYKWIEDSRYEIPKWKEVDRIRIIGDYILALKDDGEIVYHNCEPEYAPELKELDGLDFDKITYRKLENHYATEEANVEYALPEE